MRYTPDERIFLLLLFVLMMVVVILKISGVVY